MRAARVSSSSFTPAKSSASGFRSQQRVSASKPSSLTLKPSKAQLWNSLRNNGFKTPAGTSTKNFQASSRSFFSRSTFYKPQSSFTPVLRSSYSFSRSLLSSRFEINRLFSTNDANQEKDSKPVHSSTDYTSQHTTTTIVDKLDKLETLPTSFPVKISIDDATRKRIDIVGGGVRPYANGEHGTEEKLVASFSLYQMILLNFVASAEKKMKYWAVHLMKENGETEVIEFASATPGEQAFLAAIQQLPGFQSKILQEAMTNTEINPDIPETMTVVYTNPAMAKSIQDRLSAERESRKDNTPTEQLALHLQQQKAKESSDKSHETTSENHKETKKPGLDHLDGQPLEKKAFVIPKQENKSEADKEKEDSLAAPAEHVSVPAEQRAFKLPAKEDAPKHKATQDEKKTDEEARDKEHAKEPNEGSDPTKTPKTKADKSTSKAVKEPAGKAKKEDKPEKVKSDKKTAKSSQEEKKVTKRSAKKSKSDEDKSLEDQTNKSDSTTAKTKTPKTKADKSTTKAVKESKQKDEDGVKEKKQKSTDAKEADEKEKKIAKSKANPKPPSVNEPSMGEQPNEGTDPTNESNTQSFKKINATKEKNDSGDDIKEKKLKLMKSINKYSKENKESRRNKDKDSSNGNNLTGQT